LTFTHMRDKCYELEHKMTKIDNFK
jgi:hypothetical protein